MAAVSVWQRGSLLALQGDSGMLMLVAGRECPALHDRLDRIGYLNQGRSLDDVCLSAASKGLLNKRFLGVTGNYDYADARQVRSKFSCGLKAIEDGHRDVQEYDVGMQRLCCVDRRLPIFRLGNHFTSLLHDEPKSGAENRVVVSDDNAVPLCYFRFVHLFAYSGKEMRPGPAFPRGKLFTDPNGNGMSISRYDAVAPAITHSLGVST